MTREIRQDEADHGKEEWFEESRARRMENGQEIIREFAKGHEDYAEDVVLSSGQVRALNYMFDKIFGEEK